MFDPYKPANYQWIDQIIFNDDDNYMLVATDKQRARRQAELDQPEIDRLMKKAAQAGGRFNSYHAILAGKYGIEGDYARGDYGDPEGIS